MAGGIQRQGCAGPLAALLGMLALVVLMVGSLWLSLRVLSAQFVVAVIAGSSTILVSVVFLIVSRHYERHRESEIEAGLRKRPVYEEFLEFWSPRLLATRAADAPLSEREIDRFSAEFNRRLIVWGSDEVVKEYAAFRAILAATDLSRPDGLRDARLAFERLLFEIRFDMGHPNRNLETGDLLSTFGAEGAQSASSITPPPSSSSPR